MMGIALAIPTIPGLAKAQEAQGNWQAKAFLSGVLPDASIIEASGPAAPSLAGADSRGSDNWVPTMAVEYFVSDAISVETICCATGHHMTGTGALAGTPLIDNAIIMPFTLTGKYHFDLSGIRPYLGAGPAFVVFADKETSEELRQMGLQNVAIPGQLGIALQAGFDLPLNDDGLVFSIDAKRYFVRPTARFSNAAGDVLLTTRHKLDPLVIGAGFGLRF